MSGTADSIPFEALKLERLKDHHVPILRDFICSDRDLRDFLIEDALHNQRDRFSSTFLVFFEGGLVGYFTIINDCIDKREIRKKDGIKHYHYTSYPALKIARLATNQNYEGRDIGTHMLSMIYWAYEEISVISGCRFITVDAKIKSQGFYAQFGFQFAKGSKKSMLMTLDSLPCNVLRYILLKICKDKQEDEESIPMYIDYHKILEMHKPSGQQLISTP